MTKTNNQSAYSLDNQGQAEPLGLSFGSCFKLRLGRLSCIEEKLFCIEKKPQNVTLY